MGMDSTQVAVAHDAMADEYDQLDSLWYAWLYIQIHDFIARNLKPTFPSRPMAFDAGCGTGFQSFLLCQAGFDVLGIDIARELVVKANGKIPAYAVPPLESPPLFQCQTWKKVADYHKRLAKRLDRIRDGREVTSPVFEYGDMLSYDLSKDEFDVIACCGSVLSFIEDYRTALQRMISSLRPGGMIFLEVEQKWNLDLLWPFLDNLIGGKLGYEQTWKECFGNLFSSPAKSTRLDYPFELMNGETVVLPIWLFAVADLTGLFRSFDLKIIDRLGVHWATNVIPSTVLHRSNPGKLLSALMTPLALLDGGLGRLWPMHRWGCSAVFALQKCK